MSSLPLAAQAHVEKARRHADVFRRLDADVDPDWKAVTAFYVALHLVSAVLAQRGLSVNRHTERQKALLRQPDLRPIRRLYRALKNASEVARYDVTAGRQPRPTSQACKELLRHRFHGLRDTLCGLLGLACGGGEFG